MPTQQLMRIAPAPEPALGLRARLQLAWRSFTLGPLTSSSPELAKFFNGGSSSAGIAVDETTALTHSAVWAAVTLISDDIASLPLMLYKRLKNGGKDRYEEHPLYRLLHDAPNPELSTMQWRRTMQSHALLWGNGYSEIERDGANRPVALWPLTPDRVTPFRATSRSALQYKVSNSGGAASVIDATNMLVLPNLSYEGLVGYRVIEKMRESIGLSLAAERYGSYAFSNGLSFGGVILYEGNPNDETKKNNREVLERRHAGVENARKFLALYGGAKFQASTTTPHDAQYQELRTFQIREVARWFKVPPHKLADLADATYSNVEQQNLDYYTSCLRPWLELWEQELGRKLIAASERNIQFVEHIADGLLRADAAGRGEMYSKRFSVGSMTPNEIRNAENADPLTGGDRAFVPLNMIPLDRVDEYITSLITASKPPAAPAPAAAPAPEPAADPAKTRALEEVTDALRDALKVVEARNHEAERLTARLEAARGAVRAVLVAKLQSLLDKEADRARKAQATPQKFSKWLETFYALHADVCRAALRPALRAWLVVNGRAEALDTELDALVVAHVRDSERQLRAVLEEGTADGLGVPLEQLLRRWDGARAEATVERLTREAT